MGDIKIAVIGGGSSYTPELIEGFIKRADTLPVGSIYLADIEMGAEKLAIVGALARRMLKRAGLNIPVYTTLNRQEAISGADFVLTQLRVGGLQARIKDEEIPLKYQVIGQETTGAGGFAKAIRTIPVISEICYDIEKLAPEAWLINFTNPAGIVTEFVLKHTSVKAIGLCNVPIGMIHHIAKLLKVDSSRIRIDLAGLNHLVYGKAVYLDGMNITDRLIEALIGGQTYSMENIPDMKWDPALIKSLGVIPCPYHRYYYMQDEMLKDELDQWTQGKGTRGRQVAALEQELFKRYQDRDLDIKPPELEKRGGAYYSDAAVSLVNSIYNDTGEIHVVNVLNQGAIADLPPNSVVETNAVVNRSGAVPIAGGKLPQEVVGLVQAVKAYEALTIEAAVTGSYDKALQALLAHPLIPSIGIAKKILKDILKAHHDYLPQFDI
ncbi:6-phospho-beta-glucosidase [Alkaliphilus crotonatoxidans]